MQFWVGAERNLAAALIPFGWSGIILHNCLVCAAIQTATSAGVPAHAAANEAGPF